jgi:nitrilase
MNLPSSDLLTVGLAQISSVMLDREATTEKIVGFIAEAANQGCGLVVFGEAVLPGYPFWIEWTNGARFNSSVQKDLHAHYLEQAVQIEAGHLDRICAVAAKHEIAVILGIIERPMDRGGYSVYCSRVHIGADGGIASVHRKLMPTYEERLSWAPGDGHGLQVHPVGPFTVGSLNCFENWMPLTRSALYAQGEDLHVAIWPGNVRNTVDITRFISQEARTFTISVSGLFRKEDFTRNTPHYELLIENCPPVMANGGSCISSPSGEWIIEPTADVETLLIATLDQREVRRERQNFDPAGHYSRPDVTRLEVDRRRQNFARFSD